MVDKPLVSESHRSVGTTTGTGLHYIMMSAGKSLAARLGMKLQRAASTSTPLIYAAVLVAIAIQAAPTFPVGVASTTPQVSSPKLPVGPSQHPQLHLRHPRAGPGRLQVEHPVGHHDSNDAAAMPATQAATSTAGPSLAMRLQAIVNHPGQHRDRHYSKDKTARADDIVQAAVPQRGHGGRSTSASTTSSSSLRPAVPSHGLPATITSTGADTGKDTLRAPSPGHASHTVTASSWMFNGDASRSRSFCLVSDDALHINVLLRGYEEAHPRSGDVKKAAVAHTWIQ